MANPAAVRAYVVAMGQTRLAYALCPNCGAESRDQTVTIRHVLDCHVTAFTPGACCGHPLGWHRTFTTWALPIAWGSCYFADCACAAWEPADV